MDVKNRMCYHPGCVIRASFTQPGSPRPRKSPRYCSTHRPDGYVCNVRRPCEFPNCGTQSSYGKYGRPLRCAQHKLVGDTSCASRQCACGRRASFAPSLHEPPQYCSTHKGAGHYNVTKARCMIPDCTRAGDLVADFEQMVLERRCRTHRSRQTVRAYHSQCVAACALWSPPAGGLGDETCAIRAHARTVRRSRRPRQYYRI